MLFNFFFCFFYREFSGSNVIKRIFFWKHQAKWKDLDENISNLSNVVTMQPWIMEPSTKQLYTEEPGSIWYEQNENVKFQFEMLLVWTSTDLTLSLFYLMYLDFHVLTQFLAALVVLVPKLLSKLVDPNFELWGLQAC